MRSAFTLLEVTVATSILALTLVVITTTLRSGTDTTIMLTEKTERAAEEQRVLEAFKENIRGADPTSFVLSGDADGCLLSFNAPDPRGDFHDAAGNTIYELGYMCRYNDVTDVLTITAIDLKNGSEWREVELDDVSEFGFFLHKKYRACQIALNNHVISFMLRTAYETNVPDKPYISYALPPFIPLKLNWSNLDELLPLQIETEIREADEAGPTRPPGRGGKD